jgi:hypothetical protein
VRAPDVRFGQVTDLVPVSGRSLGFPPKVFNKCVTKEYSYHSDLKIGRRKNILDGPNQFRDVTPSKCGTKNRKFNPPGTIWKFRCTLGVLCIILAAAKSCRKGSPDAFTCNRR